jgi:putative transposase
VLNSERFCDMAPAQVWATVLDEGTDMCSVSTMYRLLRARHQVRERRRVARPPHLKPELVATAANQVWSWDITKLRGPYKWRWFHLYVILDVYSRYVVGWLVAPRESAALAEELITTAIAEQAPTGQLTIHADRGSSMTSKTVTQLLADLGVLQSHSRPHQSNDNPSPRPSSRRSSTGRASRAGSGAPGRPGRSAGDSSTTTTTATVTPGLPCTTPPTSTSVGPSRFGPPASSSWTAPMPLGPIASSGRRWRRHCRPRRGSTDRRRKPAPQRLSPARKHQTR